MSTLALQSFGFTQVHGLLSQFSLLIQQEAVTELGGHCLQPSELAATAWSRNEN